MPDWVLGLPMTSVCYQPLFPSKTCFFGKQYQFFRTHTHTHTCISVSLFGALFCLAGECHTKTSPEDFSGKELKIRKKPESYYLEEWKS